MSFKFWISSFLFVCCFWVVLFLLIMCLILITTGNVPSFNLQKVNQNVEITCITFTMFFLLFISETLHKVWYFNHIFLYLKWYLLFWVFIIFVLCNLWPTIDTVVPGRLTVYYTNVQAPQVSEQIHQYSGEYFTAWSSSTQNLIKDNLQPCGFLFITPEVNYRWRHNIMTRQETIFCFWPTFGLHIVVVFLPNCSVWQLVIYIVTDRITHQTLQKLRRSY